MVVQSRARALCWHGQVVFVDVRCRQRVGRSGLQLAAPHTLALMCGGRQRR